MSWTLSITIAKCYLSIWCSDKVKWGWNVIVAWMVALVICFWHNLADVFGTWFWREMQVAVIFQNLISLKGNVIITNKCYRYWKMFDWCQDRGLPLALHSPPSPFPLRTNNLNCTSFYFIGIALCSLKPCWPSAPSSHPAHSFAPPPVPSPPRQDKPKSYWWDAERPIGVWVGIMPFRCWRGG
jgi:hypothetical protein